MKIAKSAVSVYGVDQYTWEYGHRPQGTGRWMFQIGKDTNPDKWFAFFGTYTEAKKAAIEKAAECGITYVKVLC